MPRLTLRTCDDIRRFLSKITLETYAGKLEPNLAGRLGFLCSVSLKAIELGEIEAKFAELETLAEGKLT